MSYSTLKAALITQLAAALAPTPVLGYIPRAIEGVTVVVLKEGFTRPSHGQVTIMDYSALVRLLVPWLDFEEAELLLDPFVNAIPAAIDADQTLGGSITNGLAVTPSGQAGWWTLSGVEYRILDITVSLKEKGPYKGGL